MYLEVKAEKEKFQLDRAKARSKNNMAQKGINFKITAVNKTKQAFGQIGRGLKGLLKPYLVLKVL